MPFECNKIVSVIGMGYTGIPTAILFAQHFVVYGIQRASESGKRKIGLLNNCRLPLNYNEPELENLLKKARFYSTFNATDAFEEPISMSDLITINIQTPVAKLIELHKLLDNIIPLMKDGAVLSIESTIPPGTVDAIKAARWPGLLIVHAPERVNPGRLVWNIRNYDRIIGGDSESVEAARPFYQSIMDKGHIITMKAIEAEIAKTAENAVRDVQIAVSNQLALYCEEYGANFYTIKNAIDGLAVPGCENDVRRAMLDPGAGVGGHCLTKDSYLLEYGLNKRVWWPHSIFIQAREINKFMPFHLFNLLKDYPDEIHNIALIGYAYKPDVDDDRESPTDIFYNRIKGIYNTKIHDPFCKNELCSDNLTEVLSGANVVIIFTAHSEYLTSPLVQDPEIMEDACCSKSPLMVIDGRNVIKDPLRFVDEGIIFRAIGRGDLR